MLTFQQYLQKHTPINADQFEILKKHLTTKSFKKGKVLLTEGEEQLSAILYPKGYFVRIPETPMGRSILFNSPQRSGGWPTEIVFTSTSPRHLI